jgi:hypothetical protein
VRCSAAAVHSLYRYVAPWSIFSEFLMGAESCDAASCRWHFSLDLLLILSFSWLNCTLDGITMLCWPKIS